MDTFIIAHKTANVISVVCLMTLLFSGLDLLLPATKTKEIIQTKWHREYVVKGKYSKAKTVKDMEKVFLQTTNATIAVDGFQNFSTLSGDTLVISKTPIFGIVTEVHLLSAGEIKLFDRSTSLMGNFIFIPIALLFTSVLGLINYKNREQAISYASGSIILAIIIIWL